MTITEVKQRLRQKYSGMKGIPTPDMVMLLVADHDRLEEEMKNKVRVSVSNPDIPSKQEFVEITGAESISLG